MSALPALTSSQTPDAPAGRVLDLSAASVAHGGASFPFGAPADGPSTAGASVSAVSGESWYSLRAVAAAVAAVTGAPECATYHRLYRRVAALERAGQARSAGARISLHADCVIDSRPVRGWLVAARSPAPPALAGYVLPPGAETWSDADRGRFLATHALLRAWIRFCEARRGAMSDDRREAARLFSAAPAAVADLPGAGATETVAQWCAARGLSLHPRRLRAYRAAITPGSPAFDGNVDRRGRRGDDGAADMSPEAWETFRAWYLAPQRLPIAACWRYVSALAAERGWAWPRLAAIRRRVRREIRLPELTLARVGPRAFEAAAVPKIQRDIEAIAAGEWWCLDGRVLDQFVRVPDARREWRPVRPVVLGVMDVRSRSLALHLSLTESADAILAGVAKALRAWGAPAHVTLDNGEAYKAAAGHPRGTPRQRDAWRDPRIGSVFSQLGVALHNSLPYHSWAKGIESIWRRLKDDFDRWSWSFCGGAPHEKPEQHARMLAARIDDLPTLEQLAARLDAWLDLYHATEQSGAGTRGLCPRLVFEQYRGPRRVVDEAVIAQVCATRYGPVKVGRDGVRFRSLRYGQCDPDVWALRGRQVYIIADPLRADQVTLADEHGRALCVATSTRLSGATQEDRREAARVQARARRLAREAAATREDLRRTPADQVLAVRRRAAEARAAAAAAALPAPEAAPVQIVRPDLVEAGRKLADRAARRAARHASSLSSGNRDAFELLETAPPREPPQRCQADLIADLYRAG